MRRMPLPRISIVTVCLNAADVIKRLLQSIDSQAYPNVEHIIIDGGSTDGTVELVAAPKRRDLILLSEADRGIYDAMNKGVRLATGDIVAILNADDYYQPGALVAVANAWLASPEVDLICARTEIIDIAGSSRGLSNPRIDLSTGTVVISHPAAFVARAAYQKYGAYNTSYKYAADWDFFCRLVCGGARFRFVDQVTSTFVLGGYSARVGLLKEREIFRIAKDHFGIRKAAKMFINSFFSSYLSRRFGKARRRIRSRQRVT